MNSLDGKSAFVTGGASGIGQATALAYAERGARVLVADVDADGAQETLRLIGLGDGEANFVNCDVGDAASVEAAVNRCVELYGRIDCAFNNAGILGDMSLTADCSEENFDRIMRVNLKGIWLSMKYEIPHMLRQGGGVIVNTASNAGMTGTPELGVYSATKGGVVMLTRSAALEYARSNIRINCVCPGLISTPMVAQQAIDYPDAVANFTELEPIGRMGRPEEIAEAVVWLSSDAASFVTGHPMAVDGGILA
ncbi:MAG: glucose 1-dehydrogenase [Caldilineaceae bacterium]|nr:glucose 1-dehydrogenase [Caldilineaceae bacterium]